ncbi:hypothetical protein BH24GEM3_BH24GEM3_01780 [soil metagenome]
MSTQTAPHPPGMSWEEFLEWCDEDTYAEWVDGEVILMSPNSTRHQRLLIFLTRLLPEYVERRRLGEMLVAPYLMRLPRSAREPDLLFVTNEHAGRIRATYLDGPADLAIEIVSPESRTRDRREKLREYEEAGVREYWILDPERQQAEFYALAESGRYAPLPMEDGIFRSLVLPGLWLKVEWFWQEPLPSPMSVLREWEVV